MTVRFTVHTTHPWSPRGWIWVVVHDTLEELRTAAGRYSAGQFDHTETNACFQGAAFRVHVDDDGMVDEPGPRFAGVLRLAPEHGVATLAHECTHAALAMYLRQHAPVLDLTSEAFMEHEEVLCYAVGDLVGAIVVELKARDVWP